MTRDDLKNLPLPIGDMDNDERRLFDGLYDDFQNTMFNLTHMILANPHFGKEPIIYSMNEYTPRYSIRVLRHNKEWSSVHYRIERMTPGNPATTIVCAVNDTMPAEELTIDGARMASITAIAHTFVKIYRWESYGKNA